MFILLRGNLLRTGFVAVPVYPLGAQGPGEAQKAPDKLDFTRFPGYKFRSSSAKGACRSSTPRTRNELKSALLRGSLLLRCSRGVVLDFKKIHGFVQLDLQT
ncbi:hypothetical protein TNCV_4501671 [Trichonephila clavipes]|nr:hypothetical protein TNCV_4501671 [Trichonephila clavipes]